MGCACVVKKHKPVLPVNEQDKNELPVLSQKSTSIPAVNIEPPKDLALLEFQDETERQLEQLAGIF